MQVGRQRFGRRDDKGQVRVAGLAQRGRHADADRIRLQAGGKIGGGAQFAGIDQARHLLGWNIHHVAFAAVDALDLFGDRVDPDDLETGFGKDDRQRQADISQAQIRRRPRCGLKDG